MNKEVIYDQNELLENTSDSLDAETESMKEEKHQPETDKIELSPQNYNVLNSSTIEHGEEEKAFTDDDENNTVIDFDSEEIKQLDFQYDQAKDKGDIPPGKHPCIVTSTNIKKFDGSTNIGVELDVFLRNGDVKKAWVWVPTTKKSLTVLIGTFAALGLDESLSENLKNLHKTVLRKVTLHVKPVKDDRTGEVVKYRKYLFKEG